MKTLALHSNCIAIVIALMTTIYVVAADLPNDRSAAARRPAIVIRDVALRWQGTLIGALIDSQGAPVPNERVLIRQQAQVFGEAESDENGQFILRGIRGGVYQVEANGGASTLRAWAPGSAPPSAEQGVVIVADGEILRGQNECNCQGPCVCGSPPFTKWHVHGAIWGGLVTGLTYWILDYNEAGS